MMLINKKLIESWMSQIHSEFLMHIKKNGNLVTCSREKCIMAEATEKSYSNVSLAPDG